MISSARVPEIMAVQTQYNNECDRSFDHLKKKYVCNTCKYEKSYTEEINDIENGVYTICNHREASKEYFKYRSSRECWKKRT